MKHAQCPRPVTLCLLIAANAWLGWPCMAGRLVGHGKPGTVRPMGRGRTMVRARRLLLDAERSFANLKSLEQLAQVRGQLASVGKLLDSGRRRTRRPSRPRRFRKHRHLVQRTSLWPLTKRLTALEQKVDDVDLIFEGALAAGLSGLDVPGRKESYRFARWVSRNLAERMDAESDLPPAAKMVAQHQALEDFDAISDPQVLRGLLETLDQRNQGAGMVALGIYCAKRFGVLEQVRRALQHHPDAADLRQRIQRHLVQSIEYPFLTIQWFGRRQPQPVEKLAQILGPAAALLTHVHHILDAVHPLFPMPKVDERQIKRLIDLYHIKRSLVHEGQRQGATVH